MVVDEYVNVFDRLCFKVTTDKLASDLHVTPHPSGYQFYQVTQTQGRVANELQTRFSSPDVALQAIRKYLASRKESSTVRRDKRTLEREKDKLDAKKLRSDNQSKVQQGTTD